MTTQDKILYALYQIKPEDINCADAQTAISEIFDTDFDGSPYILLEFFIRNCSTDAFVELKSALKEK